MQRPTSRAVVTVLLLQLGMFVAVPLVHAEAEAAALTTPLHISSEVDHGCATHVDDLCQLCRWSTRAVETATLPITQIPGSERRVTTQRSATNYVAILHAFSALGPRAPPA